MEKLTQNSFQNSFKELFNFLKKRGLFTQYEDYEDFCEKRGIKKKYTPPNNKEENTQEEINVDELFD